MVDSRVQFSLIHSTFTKKEREYHNRKAKDKTKQKNGEAKLNRK